MALNGKRMQTFFNEFLITTTSFLNQFASNCEEKFFEFERKLNKIESNLLIVEQKVYFYAYNNHTFRFLCLLK